LLPLEFIVEGTPVSLQSHNRKILQAWKQKVRIAAQPLWASSAPVSHRIQVTILYLYLYNSSDLDNIIKPILDALNGLVYIDDKQITDIQAKKRAINEALPENLLDILAEGIRNDKSFVYILVDIAPDQTRLDL
jgi:crossover junction endodeoxyribonuclease RusA